MKAPVCQGVVISAAVSMGLSEEQTRDTLNAVSDFLSPQGLTFEDIMNMSPEEKQAFFDRPLINPDSKVINFFKELFAAESSNNGNKENQSQQVIGSGVAAGGAGDPGDWEPEDKDKSQADKDQNAQDRLQHENYKDELRAQMEKPDVKDPHLKEITDKLYRPNAQIGNGSTADAVRHEAATGQQVGGRLHLQKAQDTVKELQTWLRRNPTASSGDRAAAENMLKDLQNALRGK